MFEEINKMFEEVKYIYDDLKGTLLGAVILIIFIMSNI